MTIWIWRLAINFRVLSPSCQISHHLQISKSMKPTETSYKIHEIYTYLIIPPSKFVQYFHINYHFLLGTKDPTVSSHRIVEEDGHGAFTVPSLASGGGFYQGWRMATSGGFFSNPQAINNMAMGLLKW